MNEKEPNQTINSTPASAAEKTSYPFIRQISMDKADLTLYGFAPDLPLVVLISASLSPEQLIQAGGKNSTPQFNLLQLSGFDWDGDLSPWPHDPVVMKDDHFTGQAPAFLSWIEQTALPWARHELGSDPCWYGLAGYSMGGLFATWSALNSTIFTRFVSASGSLWYPDFAQYVINHIHQDHAQSIYFSLGNTETRTRNPWLQTTGDQTMKIMKAFKTQGSETIFEWNPGNHFQDPQGRLLKGIEWMLSHPED